MLRLFHARLRTLPSYTITSHNTIGNLKHLIIFAGHFRGFRENSSLSTYVHMYTNLYIPCPCNSIIVLIVPPFIMTCASTPAHFWRVRDRCSFHTPLPRLYITHIFKRPLTCTHKDLLDPGLFFAPIDIVSRVSRGNGCTQSYLHAKRACKHPLP